jgi:hypothetical protein
MKLFQGKHWYLLVLDLVLLIAAGALLYNGSSWQFSNQHVDAAIYQCYATAFWQGSDGLQQLPQEQCAFLNNNSTLQRSVQALQKYHAPQPIIQLVKDQSASVRFHTLPREYPVLSLFAFSVPLIAPSNRYQEAYAIWSMLIIALLYFFIVRFASRKSAIIFLVYMVIAGWSTAVSRFDIFPAATTLIALLLANNQRWTWAYIFIAMGTLFKFFPIILLPIFFVVQQKEHQEKWYVWSRWKAAVLGFGATTCGLFALSLGINIPGTVGEFMYFSARPLEVESLAGSLIWLGNFFGFPYHYVYAFVSMNVESSLSKIVGPLFTILLVAGLLLILWLQMRNRLDLKMATLTTLALILATSKILSPQYMIWIIPLVACVGKVNWRWIIPWLATMAITYYIYPVLYTRSSPPPEEIFAFSLARGLIIAGFAAAILIFYGWPRQSTQQATLQPAHVETPKVVDKASI